MEEDPEVNFGGRSSHRCLTVRLTGMRGPNLDRPKEQARLAMLAAGQGSLEQICTRPKISEVLEPQPSLVMHYQEKQEQYKKIYRSLEDFF